MNIEDLQFKQLDLNGLKTLMQWAADEGWNPGPYDADVFYQTDPEGFYGYYYDNELIAGGSIVSYDGAFGFMGLFIVKPAHRSSGIGRQLWYQRRDKLLSRLNEGASIGMDGVVAMQPFYNQGGFEIAFRDERYEKQGATYDIDPHISAIDEHDIEEVLAYDKKCFGFARPQFMLPWLKLEGTQTFKYTEGGELRGFAIVRKLGTGYKVCPLFADNYEVAAKLYEVCLNAANGASLFIDIPVNNTSAVQLVKDYNAAYVFECARMYYGTPPPLPVSNIFGITTFELG